MAIIWTQGTISEGLPMALTRRDGSPLNLTGLLTSNITLMVKRSGGGLPSTFTALTGAVTIDNAALGQITYKFSANDVANAGRYLLLVKCDFGGVVGPYYTDAQEFLIASTTT